MEDEYSELGGGGRVQSQYGMGRDPSSPFKAGSCLGTRRAFTGNQERTTLSL